jgi:hypothetical protein
MNVNEVREKVQEIGTLVKRKDYEAAHLEEDKLHQEVMLHVVSNRYLNIAEARTLLALALTTRDIEFARYCG